MLPDLLQVVSQVAQALETLGIPYLVGGSVASSRYGVPRMTQDADLVVDLRLHHVEALVHALQDTFYVDPGPIRDAIRLKSCFNIIHSTAIYKIDMFVIASGAWARQEMQRRRLERAGIHEELEFYFSSPEDIILHKLHWYRSGGGVSERQWNDVLGVLKVQATELEYDYLDHWAAELGLTDLLVAALQEANIP